MSDESGGDEGSAPTPRITADQAFRDILASPIQSAELEVAWETRNEIATASAQERWVRLRGLREHFLHKGWWSGVLLATIVFMVGFESALIGLVGAGIWDFTHYEWLLPTLMIQFLAQIVGLGLLVVKSLFNRMD